MTLLDHLFRDPTVSVNNVCKFMNCTFQTAAKLTADFESRSWLQEVTGHERNRIWRDPAYLEHFHQETLGAMAGLSTADAGPTLVTGS